MGLELEEMVIRAEQEFDISISDDDAVTITTPRQFVDYLVSREALAGRSRDAIAESVWQIVEDVIGIKRKDFTENSRFIEDMGAG